MESEDGSPVELYIYDLTHGMASLFSPALLGHQIEGVWHTSVVVFDQEYYYGASGISCCEPGSTSLGAPLEKISLGATHVTKALFTEWLKGLANSAYHGNVYNLLSHNCNHFSEEASGFLCGAQVPKHILLQAEKALSPPALRTLDALLNVTSVTQSSVGGVSVGRREDSPEFLTLNEEVEQARMQSQALTESRNAISQKLAKREKRKEKKNKHKLNGTEPIVENMAEAVVVNNLPSSSPDRADQDDADKPKEKPVLYDDIDGISEFERFTSSLEKADLSEEERNSLEELRQYVVENEGSWVLGDNFMQFVRRILHDAGLSESGVALCRVLSWCSLRRNDLALMLHGDRHTHAILSKALSADLMPDQELQSLTHLVVNLFACTSSSEWLLYISEWEEAGKRTCNLKATTKLCVTALLHSNPNISELGSALLYNIATKDVKTVVFEEAGVELGLAALQFLSMSPRENEAFLSSGALARLSGICSELPQLVQMVGPDPSQLRGMSQRVDEQIDLILKKMKK